MTGLEVCIVILLAALVCAFIASLVRDGRGAPEPPAPPERPPAPGEWLERAIHRRLVVHVAGDETKESMSIEGLLTVVGEDGILLHGAKLLGATPVDLAGEIFVPRPRVLFVQTVRM